ncbi:MAG: amidohydrolase family protein [Acidimicrobiia bacterium]
MAANTVSPDTEVPGTGVKIWANSGDSHYLEPEDLWGQILPKQYAERMPRTERISENEEVIHVDGQSFKRDVSTTMSRPIRGELRGEQVEGSLFDISHRPAGARDPRARLADLDAEGIWGEVIYPSIGIWAGMMTSPDLIRVAFHAVNEWRLSEVQGLAPDRWILVPSIPVVNLDDALAEIKYCAESGYHAVGLGCDPPEGCDNWNSDVWEPMWSAIEEAGLVIAVHLGTELGGTKLARGPGKAVLNYVETTYGPQRFATKMVASGILERHPDLKVLISEGGASWVPFIGDRILEGYRQHGMFVRPKLEKNPKEVLFRQVYTSFQHDVTAVDAAVSGYTNMVFGSDYPHMEGTFGHTQETLHDLFDDADPALRRRIMIDAFRELFPHVSLPPSTEYVEAN